MANADPLLYDFIRDLEPLPSFDCLKDIQTFHASVSSLYGSRDQFLKFVSRAPLLPLELFLLRYRSLISLASLRNAFSNGVSLLKSSFASQQVIIGRGHL
ncbi:hypothetical protein ABZP36_011727 [Zizania latifolia]